MFRAVDADRVQASQVKFLRIARLRLENDLILRVHLHTVGILTVAAVIGAVAGFDVGDVPRFGTEHAQYSGRVHGARADLLAVGLPDQTAVLGPVALQAHDDLLKGRWSFSCHDVFLGSGDSHSRCASQKSSKCNCRHVAGKKKTGLYSWPARNQIVEKVRQHQTVSNERRAHSCE